MKTLPVVLEANIHMMFQEAQSFSPLVLEMNPSDPFFVHCGQMSEMLGQQKCAGFSFLTRNNVESSEYGKRKSGSSLISTQ